MVEETRKDVEGGGQWKHNRRKKKELFHLTLILAEEHWATALENPIEKAWKRPVELGHQVITFPIDNSCSRVCCSPVTLAWQRSTCSWPLTMSYYVPPRQIQQQDVPSFPRCVTVSSDRRDTCSFTHLSLSPTCELTRRSLWQVARRRKHSAQLTFYCHQLDRNSALRSSNREGECSRKPINLTVHNPWKERRHKPKGYPDLWSMAKESALRKWKTIKTSD